jgi:hypothetical protein
MDFNSKAMCGVRDIAFNDSTMLEKVTTCSKSIHKSYLLATHKFTKIGTTTSRRARLSSSKESQWLINDDSTIGTKKI